MFQFDARTVSPQVSLDPVPEGWYKVLIRKSNMKPVRDKPNESYLELIMEIVEGQYATRVVYWNLNLFNSSQQAVEIAYKQLSAICHVVGQYQVNAQNAQDNVTPMLHNIPFMVHVVIAQGTRGPINNVRNVKDIYGNEPGKTGGAMPQQPQPGGQPMMQPAQQPVPQGWQGGNSGGTAPGGFAPPPMTQQPPANWQAPPMGAPPQQQPQYQPPAQQPVQQPVQYQPTQQPPSNGWSTQPAQQPQPQQQPVQQQPQQQPAPQQQQPAPFQPQGGPAGAAPWAR